MVPIASPFVHYRIQRPRDSCGRTARIPQRLRSKSCPLISPPGILCPVKLESGGVCCSLFFVFCCLLFVVGYCCSLIVFVVFWKFVLCSLFLCFFVICSLFFVVVVVVGAAGPNHQKYAEYGTVPQDWSHVVSTLRSNPSKHADMLYAKPISTDSNLIVQQQFDSTCKAYTNILYYFSGVHTIDI